MRRQALEAKLGRQQRALTARAPRNTEVVANMQLVAQEKGVRFILENNAPCELTGDRTQLRRVFYNLLDNAIKYTSASGQVVIASRTDKSELTITITDTGIGIPSEHLPRLFDRFYRVDPARTGDESGAGLGLSICQSIIRSMDGKIEVSSTVGQGTTVEVYGYPSRMVPDELRAERITVAGKTTELR